jgi:hypothetical protein
LRDKFEPLEDNTRDQVREDYRRILERGKSGSINPKVWISDWYRALARAQTYQIAEVKGFLAIQDFLQVVSVKLSPSWGSQQLATAIEANILGELVCTLEQYGKIFEALIQSNSRLPIFATLGGRSDSSYSCPCKETRGEKHPWAPTDCSILELAITGSCAKKPEPFPTDDQLRAVRERLCAKGYDRLCAQLEKKG